MLDPTKLNQLFEAALQTERPQPAAIKVPETQSAAPTWKNFRNRQAAGTSQDDVVQEEFRVIVEQKIASRRVKQRRSFAVTIVFLFTTTLGGGGWFLSDPARLAAVKSTISEIRSAGDIKSIVAKYDAALAKISAHGSRIDEASTLMGVDPKSVTEKDDLYLDHEMKSMMGKDAGPTAGGRAARLQQKFGNIREQKLLVSDDKSPVPR